MSKLKIISACLLAMASCLAMEQRPSADSGGPSGPSGAMVLANKLYEETRFLGSGEVSPRSGHERFYESILERLEARDTTQAAYRLALIYADKNRPVRNIIQLFEKVAATENALDRHMAADVRYRLACLYAGDRDQDEQRIRALLQGALAYENMLSPEKVADAKQRFAFLLTKGRGRYCDGEKAITLFQEAVASGFLEPEMVKNIQSEVVRIKTIAQERTLLNRLVLDGQLDRQLLAYAQCKLAAMFTYSDGLSQDLGYANSLLNEALSNGELTEAQKMDITRYRKFCERGSVQSNAEAAIKRGLAGSALARCQFTLAVAYKDDHEEYGDKRARELLQAALRSGGLTPADLAYAQYHLACLYDEHRGAMDVQDDKQAFELFVNVLERRELLSADCLADAQYRLARLSILGIGGEAAVARAQELLRNAINSGHLMPCEQAAAYKILGIIGSEAERNEKCTHDAEIFNRLVENELLGSIDPELAGLYSYLRVVQITWRIAEPGREDAAWVYNGSLEGLAHVQDPRYHDFCKKFDKLVQTQAELQKLLDFTISQLERELNSGRLKFDWHVEKKFQLLLLQYLKISCAPPSGDADKYSAMRDCTLFEIVRKLAWLRDIGTWRKERYELIGLMIASLVKDEGVSKEFINYIRSSLAKTVPLSDNKCEERVYARMLGMPGLSCGATAFIYNKLHDLCGKLSYGGEILARLEPTQPFRPDLELRSLKHDLYIINTHNNFPDSIKRDALERVLSAKQISSAVSAYLN